MDTQLEKATFAAGCFWGVQHYFDQVPGVINSQAGYIGGHKEHPSYDEVCAHSTGHAEAVQIEFDPGLINFGTLVKHFFMIHDPTQINRQGPDIGDNYRTAIFCHDGEQKEIAEQIIKELQPQYEKPIVTQLSLAPPFYPAEDYHQKYSERTGHGMCHIDYKPLS